MPRSLKVLITCDHCGEEIEGAEEQHPGALAISINGDAVKQIDLCGLCLRGDRNYLYVAGLISIYDQADAIPQVQPVPRRRSTSDPVTCPACGHPSPTAQGLGRHTRSAHGMSVADLRKAVEKGLPHD